MLNLQNIEKGRWFLIGERIRKNRNEIFHLTQEELSERIERITNKAITRQTIAKWENGDPIKKPEQIMALCEIFECDAEYLLCECESKRYMSELVAPALGLSEEALDNLITARKKANPYTGVLSDMLESEKLLNFLAKCTLADYGHVSRYIDIDDPFAPDKKQTLLISPQDLKKANEMQLYNVVCEFVNEVRKKNGLPAYDEL